MYKKAFLALASAACAVVAVNSASAGQLDSTSFTVQATISGSCSAITPPALLDFGTLPGTSTNTDASTTVNVTCSNTLPYNLAVSYGQAGNFNRVMKSGASSLFYQLYSDSARTIVLGDSTASAVAWIGGTGSGASQTLTVYARVPSQTTPPPGVYQDTVIASVIW